MITISNARKEVEQRRGRVQEIQRLMREGRIKLKRDKKLLQDLEDAREIIRTVGLETQKALQYHISDIASLALESIFNEPYKLVLDFVERRNKTECDILFERGGEYYKPLDSSGGGAVDVASFALRIASWSMAQQRTSNVIILDEPMRFLSENYQENASEMIKEISDKLGIQFIIVTHSPEIATKADRTFEVRLRKGVSQVKQR
jgi:DNA repair exonuclease SbcCD ATPase subunit